ncbi:2-isopropylmalate synthase [Reinekea blandensis]|uniref:2-isopropylmalate synthase n=1 Tax=Reinekea blandensis MED297 TaxID=314283 RepID=A4BJ60_9GAMM|nr:2-isopropylmalate synthase [Reinekea blandensis]EAR07813.1 2-isopropylmalate synthase [Reinekea sp. MED297] [Reinekea blandensis MED297]
MSISQANDSKSVAQQMAEAGSFDHRKYKSYAPLALRDRTWPDKQLTKAPIWCSVDLRDGNQALIKPMTVEQKVRMFQLLVKLGFKQIEIGFPSAAQPEFEFARKLIEEDLIPDDVTIQVLTQAREHLIQKTYEALDGVKKAIVHVYNSTSTVQREQTFGMNKDEIARIAVQGAQWVQDYAAKYPQTEWTFQYSPESFTGTEVDYAIDVCNQVIETWNPQATKPVIINLPATVEMSTPNVFADQIEYMCRGLAQRDHVIVSLHTHNDRGCGVAATELGLMAGADRVEGALLGNGERTGNMDTVTLAMNLYSQGIDPELDFSNVQEMIDVCTDVTDLPVHPRHPWVGELVYTAFSGSHQDAIRKSLQYHNEKQLPHWEVAYLPINPADLGRDYEAVVRINSQSGKGGVAHVLERDHGIELPKWMHGHVSKIVQKAAEDAGAELRGPQIKKLFDENFIEVPDGWDLRGYDLSNQDSQTVATFRIEAAEPLELKGRGQGALEALADALSQHYGVTMKVTQFDEHALRQGTDSDAIASVCVTVDGEESVAAYIHEDTTTANLQALLSAVGRAAARVNLTARTAETA